MFILVLGGLICLGAVQALNNKGMIHSFISLSSTIFGQYGIPGSFFDNVPILKPLLNLSRELISPPSTFRIIYDDVFQHAVSISNYWKDVNDPSYWYNETEAEMKKNNLIGKENYFDWGPDDEIIKPYQSALFGYYDAGPCSEHVIDERSKGTHDWIPLCAEYERRER